MGVDRRKSDGSARRQEGRPYQNGKGSPSLADRIGKRVTSKESPKPQPNSSRPTRNPDNPLYQYLNGQNPSKTLQKSPNTQATRRSDAHEKRLSPVERSSRPHVSREERPRLTGFTIKGQGASSNSFSIRGASSTSISIKNLAPGTSQADVCTILNSEIGEVEACTTFPVSGGLSTTAEVKFGSRIAADKAIKLLHGVLADDKRLNVSILLEDMRPASRPASSKSASKTARLSEDVDMADANVKSSDKPDLFHDRAPRPVKVREIPRSARY